MKIKVNKDKCTACGICVDTCPQEIYEIRTEGERRTAIPAQQENCSGCRTCEEKCPEGAIHIEEEIRKVKPPEGYPPEDGHFLRGNDYSPAAVVVLLNSSYGDLPVEVETLVRVAVECGAALAGTLQTANIGIEKIVANTVANSNIRYLIICGKEVEGHKAGEALKALVKEEVYEGRAIRGTRALKPYLLNISKDAVERFRKQVAVIDLIGVSDSNILKQAVWTCYQEKPTAFKDYLLHDLGAYPGRPMCKKVRWRIRRFDLLEEDEIKFFMNEMNGKRKSRSEYRR